MVVSETNHLSISGILTVLKNKHDVETSCLFLTNVRDRWYPSGRKIVPRNLVVSKDCLLYWFLSDGSIEFSNRRRFPKSKFMRIRLATDGFDNQDNEVLINKLKEIGIEAIYRAKRLYIRSKSNERFFNMLGKPPINCYKYKWGV